MVTKEEWQAAQIAERKHHTFSFEEGFEHYRDSYRQYLEYTGGSFDLGGRNILEIGPADFSGVMYCHNYGRATIHEPMPSKILYTWAAQELYKKEKGTVDIKPAESFKDHDLYILLHRSHTTEAWLFNVLQHVQDPGAIVDYVKNADIVRFFEPINCGTDECHLWNLTMEMFQEWFGTCVKHYPGNPDAKNFHTHECAYGCWIKKDNL